MSSRTTTIPRSSPTVRPWPGGSTSGPGPSSPWTRSARIPWTSTPRCAAYSGRTGRPSCAAKPPRRRPAPRPSTTIPASPPPPRRPRRSAAEVGRLLLQELDQAVRPVAPQDRAVFGTTGGELAYGAVEVDIDDLPLPLGRAHQVVELHRFGVARLEGGVDDDVAAGLRRRHRVDGEALAGVGVELVGVGRDADVAEGVDHVALLIRGQGPPRRADDEAGHEREVD